MIKRARRASPGRRGRIVAGSCAVAAAALAVAACSSSSTATVNNSGNTSSASASGGSSAAAKATGTVTVFAAASLNGAFDKIASQFEQANPGVSVKFNYAGSSSLVTSIKQGAPADVFASANTQNMTAVTDDKLESGTPQVFARNEGEIMVEKGNPKNITTVSDLSNPANKVVLCAPEVPCGSLASKIFKNADVTVKPVSEETSVTGVVTKVSLGEADAGLVYVTDVKAGGAKVAGVTIPASENSVASYPITVLKDAPNAAGGQAFIAYVLSPAGQQVLKSFGFMAPGS
jgi:molybdate transport system substrate-binding protein